LNEPLNNPASARLDGLDLARALADTGRITLTHYVAHVVPGMLILESMGWLDQRTLPEALLAAFVFFGSAIVFSALWQKRFARGPMEMLMCRLTR